MKSHSLSLETVRDLIDPYVPMINGRKPDLNTKKRSRSLVDLRIIYSRLCRNLGYSLTEIAQILNRDHTVIIHYLKQYDNLMNTDDAFRDKYFEVINYIKTIYPYESSVMDNFDQTQCQPQPSLFFGLLSA